VQIDDTRQLLAGPEARHEVTAFELETAVIHELEVTTLVYLVLDEERARAKLSGQILVPRRADHELPKCVISL
jgi:hypothetical protein